MRLKDGDDKMPNALILSLFGSAVTLGAYSIADQRPFARPVRVARRGDPVRIALGLRSPCHRARKPTPWWLLIAMTLFGAAAALWARSLAPAILGSNNPSVG